MVNFYISIEKHPRGDLNSFTAIGVLRSMYLNKILRAPEEKKSFFKGSICFCIFLSLIFQAFNNQSAR